MASMASLVNRIERNTAGHCLPVERPKCVRQPTIESQKLLLADPRTTREGSCSLARKSTVLLKKHRVYFRRSGISTHRRSECLWMPSR